MRIRRFVTVAMALLLVVATSAPTLASTPSSSPPAGVIAQEMTTAQAVSPFVTITKTGVVFDQAGAARAGVSRSVITQYASIYAVLNRSLDAQGYDWNQLLADIESHQVYTTGREQQSAEDGYMSPDATYQKTWWYQQWTFTEAETVLIVQTLSGPGAIGGILTLFRSLKVPNYLTAAALIGGFAAWLIQTIDNLGGNKGIYIRQVFGIPEPILWHN